MPILSLDVDDVLARCWDHMVASAAYAPEGNYRELFRTPLWWGEMAPCVTPSPDEIAAIVSRLAVGNWQIQVVTRRPESSESVTAAWLHRHYPWLMPFVARIFVIGHEGAHSLDKVAAVGPHRPDWAIDDDQYQIDNYLDHGVRVVAVRSTSTDALLCICREVPVKPDVMAALRHILDHAA